MGDSIWPVGASIKPIVPAQNGPSSEYKKRGARTAWQFGVKRGGAVIVPIYVQIVQQGAVDIVISAHPAGR